MTNFSLIEEPWLTCLYTSGEKRSVSLRTLLADAPAISELIVPVPIVQSALYRFLLALLMRVFPLRDDRDWKKLWDLGRLNLALIDAYLDPLHERFDLFHPTRPFYQAADPRVQRKSPLKLVPHYASGNNATLFDHSSEARGKILTPGEAAQYVIALQSYGLGGLSGIPEKFTTAPACSGISFYAQGMNLFETLLLNLMPAAGDPRTYGVISRDPRYEDLPAWEMDDPFTERDTPRGMLDYLTWQNRRVLLFPEEIDGCLVVREMTEGPGLRLKVGFIDGVNQRDPYQYFRQGSKAPLVVRFNEGRALWRDSASLLQFEQGRQLKPPPNLLWLKMLVDRAALPKTATYRLSALGMAANQAKVLFYGDERLPLPAAFLAEPELVLTLQGALDRASRLERGLYRACSVLAEYLVAPEMDITGDRPDPKQVDALRRHLDCTRVFWSELEPGFYDLMDTLPDDEAGALAEWDDLLRRQTWRAYDHAETLAGDSLKAQKARVQSGKVVAVAVTTTLGKKETDHASSDPRTETP